MTSLEGRVIESFGKRCRVHTDTGVYDCSLRGRLRQDTDTTMMPVAVGDRVRIYVSDEGEGAIAEVLPRTNKLSRPDVHRPEWEQVIVANCDLMIVVASVAQPALKTRRIDRFLLAAEKGGMQGAVVVNKIDLAEPGYVERIADIYRRVGYTAIGVSAATGEGIDALAALLADRTAFLVGASGVGKSSLLNALDPNLNIRVGDISEATGKGIHTTTNVRLHALTGGGLVADTPGLREVGLWDVTTDELPSLYPEFRAHDGTCRFRDCAHIAEPGCAVRDAVTSGDIPPDRYDGYVRIRATLPENRPY